MYWATRIVRQEHHLRFVSNNILGPVSLHPFVGGNEDKVRLSYHLDHAAIWNLLVSCK